jgi:hypothetical protein
MVTNILFAPLYSVAYIAKIQFWVQFPHQSNQGISDADWKIVFATIRAVHPKVPIIILGGHVSLDDFPRQCVCVLHANCEGKKKLHIRDCRQLDDRSMSLASGRYMETIGWMSQLPRQTLI